MSPENDAEHYASRAERSKRCVTEQLTRHAAEIELGLFAVLAIGGAVDRYRRWRKENGTKN